MPSNGKSSLCLWQGELKSVVWKFDIWDSSLVVF